MSLMNRKRGLTAAPLMTSVAFMTTGAIAAEHPAVSIESIHVSYVAADLTQPEAAQKLYLQIQRAARRVCHEPSIRDLAAHAAYQQCYDRAVDDAVAKVDASALTALHRSKTQHSRVG
jgi:UrcA family protein